MRTYLVGLLALSACSQNASVGTPSSVCSATDCQACSDSSHTNCWPLPHAKCSRASDCGGGEVCTNVGCCGVCTDSSTCRVGEVCSADGFCAPVDVPTTPIGSVQMPAACRQDADCTGGKRCSAGSCVSACATAADCAAGLECSAGVCRAPGASMCGISSALCQSDVQCGAGRACRDGRCYLACGPASTTCPVGQQCNGAVCVETTLATGECLYDAECGPGWRCINATCHPHCTTIRDCGAGELCEWGACRADFRPVH